MLKSLQKCNQNVTPAIARSVSPAPRLDPAKNDELKYLLQKKSGKKSQKIFWTFLEVRFTE